VSRAVALFREARQADDTTTVGGSGDQSKHPHGAAGSGHGGQFVKNNSGGSSKAKPAAKAPARPVAKPAAKPSAPQGVLPPPTTSRTMKLGQSGDDVRNLQYALGLLGFQVPQDGTFDGHTQAAVAQAQQRLGIKPNGHASATLLRKVQDAVRLSPCVKESAMGSAVRLFQIARFQERFDPSQPRDGHGRWTLLGAVISALRTAGHEDAARHLEDRQTASDIRRSTGRSVTAGGSVASLHLPSRRPRPDDRVVDTRDERRLGTVATVDHAAGTMRVHWDDGTYEVRPQQSVTDPIHDPARSFDAHPLATSPAARKMAAARAATPAAREVEVENKIRKAYADLATRPGEYVPLASVRDRLAEENMDRAEVDAALGRMAVQPGHHLIPWDNRKALSAKDREAALRFGGQDNHVLRIEDTTPRPMPKPAPQDQFRQHLADEVAAGRVDSRTAASAMRAAQGDHIAAAQSHVDALQTPPVDARQAEFENRIWATYKQLLGGRAPDRSAEFVSLTKVRAQFPEMSKSEFDDAIRALSRAHPEVSLEPEANQKRMTPDDRAAGVRIGGEDRHLLGIERTFRPAGAQAASPTSPSIDRSRPSAADRGHHITSDPSLTDRQKRSRLKAMGLTPEEVDSLVPTGAKKATPAASPRTAEINGQDWNLDDLEQRAGLAGRSPADLKKIAYEANLDMPSVLKTAPARRLYLLQAAMEHDRRSNGGMGGNGEGGLRHLAAASARVPGGGASPAAAKLARGKAAAAPFDVADVHSRLASAQSREEGEAILKGLSMAQLREVSPSAAGISRGKAELTDRIVAQHVGSRLSFQAMKDMYSTSTLGVYSAEDVHHARSLAVTPHADGLGATPGRTPSAPSSSPAVAKMTRAKAAPKAAKALETARRAGLPEADAVRYAETGALPSGWDVRGLRAAGSERLAAEIGSLPDASAIASRLEGEDAAGLRRLATAVSLPIPRTPRQGGTWTRSALAQYIAAEIVRDRARWSLR